LVVWDTFAGAVTARRSWLLALATVLLGIGSMVLIGENAAAGQAPMTVPADSQSARVDALVREFPGGDQAMLILVVSRTDGAALRAADVTAAQAARDRMQAVAQPAAAPALASHDGKAAMAVVPVIWWPTFPVGPKEDSDQHHSIHREWSTP
jgi:RND superfamily putative drug exporter